MIQYPITDDEPRDYLLSAEELNLEQERREEERLKSEGLSLTYKRLFATEDGKKVLEDLSHACFETAVCFFKTKYQNFVLGKRSVVLYIRSHLNKEVL